MNREDIQKLLGGYATGTLTDEEQRALFEAALDDQELFDSLAKEQALRELLREPAARQQMIAALRPVREPFAARAWRWLRQPGTLAVAGGLAVMLIAAGLVLHQTRQVARPAAIMAEAVRPRDELRQETAPAAPASSPVRRKVFRQPAPSAAKPAAPLPAPPQLAASLPAPAPAAPPTVALVKGPVNGRSMLPAPMPARQSFLAGQAQAGAKMTRAAKAMAAANFTPAGLQVVYLRLPKGASGDRVPVSGGTVFQTGDSVRLQIEPRQAGNIYLFRRDDSGGWATVESQPVEQGQRYVLPSSGGLELDAPGQLELRLVLSPVNAAPADLDAATANAAQTSLNITLEFR